MQKCEYEPYYRGQKKRQKTNLALGVIIIIIVFFVQIISWIIDLFG
jgi:hypothetical protein